MISTLLIWSYIFILSVSSGFLIFRAVSRILKQSTGSGVTILEASILGLSAIGTFLSYLSLFMKTGLLSNILLLVLIALLLAADRKAFSSFIFSFIAGIRRMRLFSIILVSLYVIVFLISAQLHPDIYDTGAYHAQFIQWISSYPAVPGLGNLHGRFAFNNQSFLLESLFSMDFLKLGYFHLVNSYLLVLISVSLVMELPVLLREDRISLILPAGLLLLISVYYLGSASSPTPDTFSAICTWTVLITWIRRMRNGTLDDSHWFILLIMAFFTVTVKISAIPLVIPSLFYIFQKRHGYLNRVLLTAFAGILVFIPFFIRNYIISGYLVYPWPEINLFSPDWKMPSANVREMKSVIESYARSREWTERPFTEWIGIWYHNLSTGFKVMSLTVALSPLFLTALLLSVKGMQKAFRAEIRVLLVCIVAFIFWFFSAPNWRFVYGFLFIYVPVTTGIILHWILNWGSVSGRISKLNISLVERIIRSGIFVLAVLFPLFFILKRNPGRVDGHLLLPEKYKEVVVRKVAVNNLIVSIPEDNAQCWNSCIPCSICSGRIGLTDIELRGEGLRQGFRVKDENK